MGSVLYMAIGRDMEILVIVKYLMTKMDVSSVQYFNNVNGSGTT